MKRIISILLILVVLTVAFSVIAYASPDAGKAEVDAQAPRVDYRMDPQTARQNEMHQVAMEAKLNGKAYGKTHEVAKGQYVELEREG